MNFIIKSLFVNPNMYEYDEIDKHILKKHLRLFLRTHLNICKNSQKTYGMRDLGVKIDLNQISGHYVDGLRSRALIQFAKYKVIPRLVMFPIISLCQGVSQCLYLAVYIKQLFLAVQFVVMHFLM